MRVLRVFMGADLRCAHEGLALLAKREKINVDHLEPGEYILFINTDKNRLKLYAANQVVAYLRLPAKEKLNLRTISLIPKAFKATGKIDYNKVLKDVLLGELSH